MEPLMWLHHPTRPEFECLEFLSSVTNHFAELTSSEQRLVIMSPSELVRLCHLCGETLVGWQLAVSFDQTTRNISTKLATDGFTLGYMRIFADGQYAIKICRGLENIYFFFENQCSSFLTQSFLSSVDDFAYKAMSHFRNLLYFYW